MKTDQAAFLHTLACIRLSESIIANPNTPEYDREGERTVLEKRRKRLLEMQAVQRGGVKC